MAGKEEDLVDRLIDLCTRDGVRLGVIGGASSLLVSEGGPRLIDVTDPPPEVRPEIETGLTLLEMMKVAPEALDWFFVSPPEEFGAWAPAPKPGPTGSAATFCCAMPRENRPSRPPIWQWPSSTRSNNPSTGDADSTPHTDCSRASR